MGLPATASRGCGGSATSSSAPQSMIGATLRRSRRQRAAAMRTRSGVRRMSGLRTCCWQTALGPGARQTGQSLLRVMAQGLIGSFLLTCTCVELVGRPHAWLTACTDGCARLEQDTNPIGPRPSLPCRPSLTSTSPASSGGAPVSAGSAAPSSSCSKQGGSARSKASSSKGSTSKPGGSKGSGSRGGSSKGSTSKGGSRLRHSSGTPSLHQKLQQGSVKKQLDELVHLAAPEAAKAMGLSLHSFRTLCRGVGIQRWPGRRSTSTAAGQDGA